MILALCALELLEQHAGFEFEFFYFPANRARLPTIFFFLILAARGIGLAFEVGRLAVEQNACRRRFWRYAVDQPLALGIGESELADGDRRGDDRAGKLAAGAAMIIGLLGFRNFLKLLFEQAGFLVELGHLVDFVGEFVEGGSAESRR